MKRLFLALLFFTVSGFAVAQSADTAVQEIPLQKGVSVHDLIPHTFISFSFVPRTPEQKPWEIEVRQDLTSSYKLKDEPAARATAITVSASTMRRLESGSAAVEAHICETKLKKIAQTGRKTITYAQGVAVSSCEFNYSDNDKLNDAANAFQAIAATIQIGEQLTRLHRYDRLGLDAEMEVLVNQVKEGRALEVGNIAPVLKSLVEDERVIDRVRRKAARLLQDAGGTDASVSPR